MTNLDRLKGTGLLIQGFDEFLAGWLGVEPNRERIDWDDSAWFNAKQLPQPARLYFDLVKKWPTAKLGKVEFKDEALEFPPLPRSIWSHVDGVYVTPDPDILKLMCGHRNAVEIWFDNAEDKQQVLHVDHEVYVEEPAVTELNVDLDEFLVTFGLNCLIVNSKYCDYRKQRLFREATPIFTGRYLLDEPRHVLYHPEGFLWFGWGAYDESMRRSDSSTHWCIQQPA